MAVNPYFYFSDDGVMSEATPAAEPVTSQPTLRQAKIMIVDDEPITTNLIQAFLQDAGYSNFIAVDDSSQALDMMLTYRPDVLLLELIMPGKTGFELLTEIRNNRILRYQSVIVLTTAGDFDTKLKALELGVTDILSKPVDASELILRIRNALTFKSHKDQLIYNDRLTGLPNRQLFMERLSWTLKQADRHNKQAALLQVGIDRFKQINDTLGHGIGDEVLKAVSSRLSATIRDSDTISILDSREETLSLSRLAGDEFIVLATEITQPEDAAIIARRLLESLRLPLQLDGHELFVSASVGIAMYPQDGVDVPSLLTKVDLAMAQAKVSGRNTYTFNSAENNARAYERLTMETALRKAIEKDDLEVYYQPKLDVVTGNIVSAEALLRWNHPELGRICPATFIPLAEETGLILKLGEAVLNRACSHAAQWQNAGYKLPVSVNVSSLQFRRNDMPAIIKATLNACGLHTDNLIIELTESLLMDNAKANIDILRAIKELGVSLSMDDFGTGFSSLSYLKRFPLDEIKIDMLFVRDLPEDTGNAAIVKSVIKMAHGLGLKTVAEGVETAGQLAFLKTHGCDQYQGYLFSPAVTATEFTKMLAENQASITSQPETDGGNP